MYLPKYLKITNFTLFEYGKSLAGAMPLLGLYSEILVFATTRVQTGGWDGGEKGSTPLKKWLDF